jgi:hypothetical protein
MMLLRPNIEHEMLGVIVGRGGTQELGATFWGQTELACYDDAQHGLWGMSYKYHERAMVTNERNMIRMFDIAFDGYSGGMDTEVMRWSGNDPDEFLKNTYDVDASYTGASLIVLLFPKFKPPEVSFTDKPNFKHFFTDFLDTQFTPEKQVWHDIDKMYTLKGEDIEKLIETLNVLHENISDHLRGSPEGLEMQVPGTLANHVNAPLKTFVNDLINMLESRTKPYVAPNPIVLSSSLSKANPTVWLDAEKNQNVTDTHKHSFIDTFCKTYDNSFTSELFEMYNERLGRAWSEDNVTSAATHIQNNTVDIPTLAYHGNMIVREAGDRQIPRDVKCVGHLGNSYPGVANIREGKGRICLQVDKNVHIM